MPFKSGDEQQNEQALSVFHANINSLFKEKLFYKANDDFQKPIINKDFFKIVSKTDISILVDTRLTTNNLANLKEVLPHISVNGTAMPNEENKKPGEVWFWSKRIGSKISLLVSISSLLINHTGFLPSLFTIHF